MQDLIFFRLVISDGIEGHPHSVNDWFRQGKQCPDRCDADTSGTDETYLLCPDHLGKSSCILPIGRGHDACQIRNKYAPGDQCPYQHRNAAGDSDQITGSEKRHGESHRQLGD